MRLILMREERFIMYLKKLSANKESFHDLILNSNGINIILGLFGYCISDSLYNFLKIEQR